VAGYSSSTFFNPVITSLYISDVSTNKITIKLSGTYDKFSIQRAASYSCSPSINYYRIVPYYTTSSTDISGRTSDVVFVPAITDITVYNIYDASMILKWNGIYDKIKIQYKYYTDSNYTDLSNIFVSQSSNTATNTITIFKTDLSGGSDGFAKKSFDFKIIPYSLGYNTTTWTTGLTSDTIYNPSVVITDISYVSSDSIILYYTPIFSYGNLYYKVATSSSYSTTYVELVEDSSYVKISKLYSDTSYNFIIIPYVFIY
jgi:hypothetical protein